MNNKFLFVSWEAIVAGDGCLVAQLIPALLKLQSSGFRNVLIDGHSETDAFDRVMAPVLTLLDSQGVYFEEIAKVNVQTIRKYLSDSGLDRSRSCIVGSGDTALTLTESLGLRLFREIKWEAIAREILTQGRRARVVHTTKETRIEVEIALEPSDKVAISTGIGYFDHMLEQLAKHGGFEMSVKVNGDLHVDEHHTVEDTALAIGDALRKALGDKRGIGRYGFVLPMDEAEARVSLDLSGRAFLVFHGDFKRETVGGLPTELVSHFFRSFSTSLGATLHVEVTGDNAHHMVESCFKGVGRALRPAISSSGISDHGIPSTKGSL